MAEELGEEILSIAKKMYTLNFKGGFDVKMYRPLIILLGGIAGLLVGAGFGLGVDKLADNFGWWKPRGLSDYRRRNYRQ